MTRPRLFRLCRALRAIVAVVCFAGVVPPAWGQFETRAAHALPNEAFAVVTGDFNADGKLDVAVLDSDGLSILLGNGDGTFGPSVTYPAGPAYSIAVSDFNGDGKPDIVVANLDANPSTVSVYLGNGDGTFQVPISSNTKAGSYFVAVGDFDNDHKPDIVLIDPPYISVLLGNGDGTFQTPSDNDSFVGAQQLTLADFNNDGRLDVAVVGYFGGSQSEGVLLGNGDGTLQSSLTYPLANTPCSVAAADFNRDGREDLVIGVCGDGVTVLLGKGDGTFEFAHTYLGGGGPVIVEDFNLDGRLDLVAGALSAPGASEFLGNGDGTFKSAQTFLSGVGGPSASGDLNGDNKPDLVLLDGHHDRLASMLNTGTLSFSPSSPLKFPVQTLHTVSMPMVVRLSNASGETISVSSIRISGPFRLDNGTTCQASIGPGATCTISIVFAPQAAGVPSGLVALVDSASSKPQIIELSGLATNLSISPTTLNFGGQKVHTKSIQQTITITNVSNTIVTFSGIGIGGPEYQDFSEVNTCLPQLAGGATCAVMVTFGPTKLGPRKGDVYFTVTPKGDSPAAVNLFGTGT